MKTTTIRNSRKLRVAIIAVCAMLVLTAVMPTAIAGGATLKLGSSGSEVNALQERLLKLGYLDYPNATGYYGTTTKTAVIRFQQNNGLSADGVAGSLTQSKLYASTARSMVLKAGSSGEAVQALQLKLKALGYFGGTGTGYYGEVTRDAVVRFQKAFGLTADGIAGPATHNKAFSASGSTSQSTASAAAIADIALTQVGKGYVLGTQGPNTYDCSGLAYYAITNAGFSATRMSAAAYFTNSAWSSVSGISNLKKGDLIFFRSESSSSISHMGIYTGNGQFVHASSGQAKVMVSTLSGYWTNLYMGARRVS